MSNLDALFFRENKFLMQKRIRQSNKISGFTIKVVIENVTRVLLSRSDEQLPPCNAAAALVGKPSFY